MVKTVRIMSLMQNMWERPLVRELRKVQARISELEHDSRDCWPKKTLGVGDLHDRYVRMDAITGLLSEAHTKRFELMKRIQIGRPHDG